jgi:hypothetical protein
MGGGGWRGGRGRVCEGVDRDMNLVFVGNEHWVYPCFLLEKAVDLGTSIICFYRLFLHALFTSPPTLIFHFARFA